MLTSTLIDSYNPSPSLFPQAGAKPLAVSEQSLGLVEYPTTPPGQEVSRIPPPSIQPRQKSRPCAAETDLARAEAPVMGHDHHDRERRACRKLVLPGEDGRVVAVRCTSASNLLMQRLARRRRRPQHYTQQEKEAASPSPGPLSTEAGANEARRCLTLLRMHAYAYFVR